MKPAFVTAFSGAVLRAPTTTLVSRRRPHLPFASSSRRVLSSLVTGPSTPDAGADQAKVAVNQADIVVFSTTYCPFCARVKSLFTQLDVPHTVWEVDTMPNGDDIRSWLMESTGQRTVPNVFIRGKHVGGCDDTFDLHNSVRLPTPPPSPGTATPRDYVARTLPLRLTSTSNRCTRVPAMPSCSLPSGPRITADYVHVVSQTLPGLPALASEVPTLLSQDAEYYVRHVIHLAKKRMRHNHRTHLTLSDIHDSSSSPPTTAVPSGPIPRYSPVPSLPGLYVVRDEIIPLRDILQRPLPPALTHDAIAIKRSGIIAPHLSFSTVKSFAHVSNPLIIAVDTLLSAPTRVPPTFVMRTLRTIASDSHALPFHPVLALLVYFVNLHASARGDADVLRSALRVSNALLARPSFGLELFEDPLLTIILTCLVAPAVGRNVVDTFDVRVAAASSLSICLSRTADAFVRQRVSNTLTAALKDPNASLPVLFGAILGIAALGPQAFDLVVMPLVPNLAGKLDKLNDMAKKSDGHVAHDVLTQIFMLNLAVERGMRACRLIAPEPELLQLVPF